MFPRPLPTAEFAREREALKKENDRPTGEGNIGVAPQKPKKKAEAEEEIPTTITIHLLEGEQRDFTLERTSIKSVEYYEDLLLAEGDRMILTRDYGKAFEYYLAVFSRDPHWKGVSERVDQVLLSEGTSALLDADVERGLRLLRELHLRKPNYPDLSDKLAKAYVARVDKAFYSGAYTLGRRVLHDIEELTPNHKSVIAAHERFINLAKRYAEAASRSEGTQKLDLWAETLRIWPTLEGAESSYKEAFEACPTLDVAVIDLPKAVSPCLNAPADKRVAPLVYIPLLASIDQDAIEGKVPGQLAASVTTADLGRKLIVQLRPNIPWSDGSRNVAASDAARIVSDQAEPFSLGYRARWGELLDHVETPDPTRLEIRLTRARSARKPG